MLPGRCSDPAEMGGRITRHSIYRRMYMSLDFKASEKFNKLDSEIASAKSLPDLTKISGYDATKTQTLKNDNGTLKWVTDEA